MAEQEPISEKVKKAAYIKEVGGRLKTAVEDNKGKFSETLQIKPDGRFKLESDSGAPISNLAHLAHTTSVTRPSSEDAGMLYELAYDVQKIFPELTFAFNRDKEGKLITYNVSAPTEKAQDKDTYKQQRVQYNDNLMALRITGKEGAKFTFNKNHKYSPANGNDAIVSTVSGENYYVAEAKRGGVYFVDIQETVKQGKLVSTYIEDMEDIPEEQRSVKFGKQWEIPGVVKTSSDVKEILLNYKGSFEKLGHQVDAPNPFTKNRQLLRKYKPFE